MVEGLLGRKLGMTQLFTDEGEVVGVSLIEVGPCRVLEVIEWGGEKRARVGFWEVPERKVKKPQKGYFQKIKQGYYKIIRELKILGDSQEVEVGTQITVEMFKDVSLVDVRGRTKGRGFAGGMKRWNWSGQPASHGSTIHRKMGSAGATTDPGRMVKGHHMPGRYGYENITVKNLKVMGIDSQNNILIVKGAIPGSRNSILFVRRAKGYGKGS